MRKNNPRLAIIYSLLASFFFAFIAYLIKIAEHHLSNGMVMFFRQFLSFCFLFPFIPRQIGSFSNLKTSCFQLHLVRVFSSLSAMFCLFFAIRYLPLVDAVLLAYTRPLFIPIVVYFWFKKKWTKNVWFGLITGFIGVILILRPDNKVFDIAALVGLGGGMFGAIAFTTIRRLTKTEPAERILFYYLALSLPFTSVLLAAEWTTPTLFDWGILLAIGFIGTIYQMLLTRAYQYAKAFKVGSLLYSSVIFAYLFDLVLGTSSIDFIAFFGIILIALGSFIALREGKM